MLAGEDGIGGIPFSDFRLTYLVGSVALALILFMIPATLIFHSFWTYPEAQFVNQFHHFFKNLAIIGTLFMVMGMGSGGMSVDKPDSH